VIVGDDYNSKKYKIKPKKHRALFEE